MKFIANVLFLLPALAFSAGDGTVTPAPVQKSYTPWFTGPLLAPTPVNMVPGHPLVEPFLTIFDTYGIYNSHWKVDKTAHIYAFNPLVDIQVGFTDYLGIEIDVSFISNFRKDRCSTHLQDSLVAFGYQVSNDKKGTWTPDFRVLIQEIFPTGNYQKLKAKNVRIDATGQGSFQTGIILAFQKLFYLPKRFFEFHWSFAYFFFQSNVKVKGLNNYGGGRHTRGTARPGRTAVAILSGEYSLNQNWVFAVEAEYSHQSKSKFSGRRGKDPLGNPLPVSLPASTQISFAPEIEYNFSPSAGLLFAYWFTIAGKNTYAFNSIAFEYVQVF